jgi:hypothetical protein
MIMPGLQGIQTRICCRKRAVRNCMEWMLMLFKQEASEAIVKARFRYRAKESQGRGVYLDQDEDEE